MVEISVIIANWNGKKYLEECLTSVFLALIESVEGEVIVVDNGSTDGSVNMIRAKFPSVRLFENNRNLGFAKAINIGIRESKGKYITIINSDVKVKEKSFVRMIEFLEFHPKIGLVGPKIVDSNGRVQRSCMGSPGLWNIFCRALALDKMFPKSEIFGGQLMTYWEHDRERAVDIINGCFWMAKREAIDRVGLLDERFFIYGEDMDWCKRFWDTGLEVVFFPEAEALHYGGASSSKAPIKFYLEMQKANLQYWRKHKGIYRSQIYIGINILHHILRIFGNPWLIWRDKWESCLGTFKIVRSIACLKWLLREAVSFEKR